MNGRIAASMMCANVMNLEGDLKTLERLGVEYLHMDIMDGCFVPNYTLGTDYVRKIKESTAIPVDIHLMVDRPEDKLDWFSFGEGDYVSFHYESTAHTQKVIQKIIARGAKAMLALNPATPLCVLEEVISELDGVLLMTVNPGFAGQKLVVRTLEKIKRLRGAHPEIEIEVDGNVSFENAVKMRAAGADIFVAGTSSVFAEGTLEDNIRKFRECIT